MVLFVFTYVNQVQTKQTFRVTVNMGGPVLFVYVSWRVVVEQLSYEKLNNAEILIDQGTPNNGAMPFYDNALHNSTADGRYQKEWDQGPNQPSNITIVWDGGSETFLFNHYPF